MSQRLGDVDARRDRDLVGEVLDCLRLGARIHQPTVVVVAHPDDEVLGMGGRLRSFDNLTILQLTDGAPRDGADANRLGFSDCLPYAIAREHEAQRSLSELGIRCCRRSYRFPDQESVSWLRQLVDWLERDLRGAWLVFTHAYEGGHPDHDTAALAVQLACAKANASGRVPPLRLEFASYHHRDGRMVAGQFWPDGRYPATTAILEEDTHRLKCRALAEHRTQSQVIAGLGTAIERYRLAPQYDFAAPPPPGIVQYDLFGWRMTAERWRERVAATVGPHHG
jgi:N-acetylglucosamine malate deacetylase 2